MVTDELGRFVKVDAVERFSGKFIQGADDDCWEWTAHRLRGGYGHFWDGHDHVKAHRFSYELFVGLIPDGMLVCHKCDNPPCVNPAHLFVGTHDDNMADKKAKGRNCYGDANGSRTHPRARGEACWSSKLSNADTLAIYAAYHESRVRQVDLAAQFGITQSRVSAIVRDHERYAWLSSQ